MATDIGNTACVPSLGVNSDLPTNLRTYSLGGGGGGFGNGFSISVDDQVLLTFDQPLRLAPGATLLVSTSSDTVASNTLPYGTAVVPPSPLTVALSPKHLASVTGTVQTRDGDEPVVGADVRLCSLVALYSCRGTTTDGRGAYQFLVVPAGPARLTAIVRGGDLLPSSFDVRPSDGETLTHDFQLSRPTPLSGGVTIESASGRFVHGVPLVSSASPLSISVPWHVPAVIDPSPPGSDRRDRVVLYAALVRLGPATGDDAGVAGGRAAGVLLSVAYRADGKAVRMSQVYAAQGLLDQSAARAAGRGARLGTRRPSEERPIASVAADCGDGVFANPNGGVTINAFGQSITFPPLGIPVPAPTGDNGLEIGIALTANAAANLIPEISAYNAIVGVANNLAAASNDLSDRDFAGNYINFTLNVLSSPLTGFEGTAAFTANFASGLGGLNLPTPLPQPPPPCRGAQSPLKWFLYVDPSGVVRSRSGAPVSGARVFLARSNSARGRLTRVPNESTIMSAANRRNPDFTSQQGSFGWDVLPGFYQVTAVYARCPAVRTRVLRVPPPAIDLVLRLPCETPKRNATRTGLHVESNHHASVVLLVARVTARGSRRPTGIMTFTDGGRVLATAPLDGRTRQATAVVLLRGRKHRLRARYRGDAVYQASTSS
jgi:hypothetical protein